MLGYKPHKQKGSSGHWPEQILPSKQGGTKLREDLKSGLGKSINHQGLRQVYSFICCQDKYGRDKYNY